MSNVYALYCEVGAYEGADFCVGIYSSLENARAAQAEFEYKDESYITKVELDRNEFGRYGDSVGKLVDAVA